MADQKDFKEKKRSKFHRTLLKLYHPPSPPRPPPPPPTLLLHEEEALEAVFGNTDQLHQGDDGVVESSSDASDSATNKLTRAQRKRIRKRKLKESASQRRKNIGPLLPPSHSKHESSEKPLQENICDTG